MIYLKNTEEKQEVYIAKNGDYMGKKTYKDGYEDGIEAQKALVEPITITKNGVYENSNGYNPVNVSIPTGGSTLTHLVVTENGSYSPQDYGVDGFDGVDVDVHIDCPECPELEEITIIQNGTYEGAYDKINVNVPQEGGECNLQERWVGYNHPDELTDGAFVEVSPEEGFDGMTRVVADVRGLMNNKYEEGYNQGKAEGGDCSEVIDNARVIEITENGYYLSQYSDPVEPQITGVFNNGDNFHNYAKIDNAVYDTGYRPTPDSKMTIWWKNDKFSDSTSILAYQYWDGIIFKIQESLIDGKPAILGGIQIDNKVVEYDIDKWHKIELSFADGFLVDDVKVGEYSDNFYSEGENTIKINGGSDAEGNSNGYFGMIVIDGHTLIPTENGWYDMDKDEYLQQVQEGTYEFFEGRTIEPEGELYKTVVVNVPKSNIQDVKHITVFMGDANDEGLYVYSKDDGYDAMKSVSLNLGVYYGDAWAEGYEYAKTEGGYRVPDGTKFAYSSFQLCDIDVSNFSDCSYMFAECRNLEEAPQFYDIRNAICMYKNCVSLRTAPYLPTSYAESINGVYVGCYNLTDVGIVDCSSLSNNPIGWENNADLFGSHQYIYLTNFGGLYNLRLYTNLKGLVALNEDSVINVFSNLYDFTGNGETPNSVEGQIVMSSHISDLVELHKNIAEERGWSVSLE